MVIKENIQFKLRSSLRQFAGVPDKIITNLNYNLLSIIVFQPMSHKKLPALTSSSSKGKEISVLIMQHIHQYFAINF